MATTPIPAIARMGELVVRLAVPVEGGRERERETARRAREKEE